MELLSRENHILWVNYHGSRRPQFNRTDAASVVKKLGQIWRGPQWAGERFLVLTPFVIPQPGNPRVEAMNRTLLAFQIRRALARFPKQPVQLWSFAPDVAYLIGQFGEELSLYYCVDEFSEFSAYDAKVTRRSERELISKCDVVITTARRLQEAKRDLHPETHLVPHGVCYEHFARATDAATEVPPCMKEIAAPVFGFFGMIQDWIDLRLIVALAKRRPGWSFVLIGKQEAPVDECAAQPNVHLLGQVPYATLPGYCRAFDVALIPFKINALTVHVNPIKLREYLAAGLPVVSTDLPEVRAYCPHVRIAKTVDEFEEACRQALQERTPHFAALRQAAVQNETWESRVEQLSVIVQRILGEQSGPPTFKRCGVVKRDPVSAESDGAVSRDDVDLTAGR